MQSKLEYKIFMNVALPYNGYILIDSLSLELITLFSLKFNFLIPVQVFYRQINPMNFLAT